MTYNTRKWIQQYLAGGSCSESSLDFVGRQDPSTQLRSSNDSWALVWPNLLAVEHACQNSRKTKENVCINSTFALENVDRTSLDKEAEEACATGNGCQITCI
jgi:hypothetical protein